MQCPQCGTYVNPAELRTGVDGTPLCPFCGASVRSEPELIERDDAWRPAQQKNDVPGLISVVCGGISILCMLLGCPTCGLTFIVAVPLSLVGIICGFWAAGGYRIAGLIMNLVGFLPSVIACAFIGWTMMNNDKNPFDRSATFSPPSVKSILNSEYRPLSHPPTPGVAFHFRAGDKNYIACTLSQFKGKRPTAFRSPDFSDPIIVDKQVHSQGDVQILTYKNARLDGITPLPFENPPEIREADDVVVRLRDRTLKGTIAQSDKPARWQFQTSDKVTENDCLGAPVIEEVSGNVLGVVVSVSDVAGNKQITFEPLSFPEAIH